VGGRSGGIQEIDYEMRFDEVSAVYALFGHFYVGVRCAATDLGKLLSGSCEGRFANKILNRKAREVLRRAQRDLLTEVALALAGGGPSRRAPHHYKTNWEKQWQHLEYRIQGCEP